MTAPTKMALVPVEARAIGTACQCPGSNRMPGRCPEPAFCPMCDVPADDEEEENDDA